MTENDLRVIDRERFDTIIALCAAGLMIEFEKNAHVYIGRQDLIEQRIRETADTFWAKLDKP